MTKIIRLCLHKPWKSERSQTVTELNRHHPLVSIQILCGLFGKSRQAWYDAQKQLEKEEFHNLMLLSEVRRLRLDLPCVGVDVLHYQLTEFRQSHGIKAGRDKLANLLRESNLLIKKKTRLVKTTWSHHRYFKYPNLTVGKKVLMPNLLWVSDITPRGAPLHSNCAWICLPESDYGCLFEKDCWLGIG